MIVFIIFPLAISPKLLSARYPPGSAAARFRTYSIVNNIIDKESRENPLRPPQKGYFSRVLIGPRWLLCLFGGRHDDDNTSRARYYCGSVPRLLSAAIVVSEKSAKKKNRL